MIWRSCRTVPRASASRSRHDRGHLGRVRAPGSGSRGSSLGAVSISKKDNGRWLVRWEEEGRHRGRTFSRLEDGRRFEAERRRQAELGRTPHPRHQRCGSASGSRPGSSAARSSGLGSTLKHRAALLDKWIVPHLSGVRLRDPRRGAHPALAPGHPRRRLLAAPVQSGPAGPVGRARIGGRRRAPSLKSVHTDQTAAGAEATPLVMTPEEIERLRAQMPSQRDRVLLGLLAYAGLRPEEALALRGSTWAECSVIDRAFTHGEEKGTKTTSGAPSR